jgi:hypothetical protein
MSHSSALCTIGGPRWAGAPPAPAKLLRDMFSLTCPFSAFYFLSLKKKKSVFFLKFAELFHPLPQSRLKHFHHPPQKKPHTHSSHSPFSSSLGLTRQPLTYLPSLWICLSWTLQIHGPTQYVALCVWLLLLSIKVCICCSICQHSFLLIIFYHIYSSVDGYLNFLKSFLLWVVYHEHSWISFCVDRFSIIFSIYLGLESLDQIISQYLNFW